MDDWEIQEADKLRKKRFLRQVVLLVGASVLFYSFGVINAPAYYYERSYYYNAASLLALLGEFLLWPLTMLVFVCRLFMKGWKEGLPGIVVWTICVWNLCKTKVWSLYFGLGAFLILAFLFILLPTDTDDSISLEPGIIISDLRSMKTAALMFRADRNGDLSNLSESENHIAALAPYITTPDKYTAPDAVYVYSLRLINGTGWVGYSLNGAQKTRVVYEKLAGRAVAVGLLKSPAIDMPPDGDDATRRYTQDADAVWMRAF
ncbi:MAG: hypothetical protein LBT15_02895 [Synergistaceae bacterium]|jgi:hypothetical protein|nr:hypothetical protein [Synergistaceae bacterium]